MAVIILGGHGSNHPWWPHDSNHPWCPHDSNHPIPLIHSVVSRHIIHYANYC